MSRALRDQYLQRRAALSHFNQRVRERLWPQFGMVDPEIVFTLIQEYIANEDPSISYVCRISRDGKRLWRIEMPPKGYFYSIVRHSTYGVYPMTVLTPGMNVGREGKTVLRLK